LVVSTRLSLVAAADDLEEQVGVACVEREVVLFLFCGVGIVTQTDRPGLLLDPVAEKPAVFGDDRHIRHVVAGWLTM
jgi:hypothetical protein